MFEPRPFEARRYGNTDSLQKWMQYLLTRRSQYARDITAADCQCLLFSLSTLAAEIVGQTACNCMRECENDVYGHVSAHSDSFWLANCMKIRTVFQSNTALICKISRNDVVLSPG